MREFIKALRDQGDLLPISEPLDPGYEISTILSELGKEEGPAVLVQKPKGYSLSVVGNLLGTKKRLFAALKTDPDLFPDDIIPRLDHPLAPVLTADPFLEERITRENGIDLLKILPVLTHYPKDTGPYITSGITSAKDPIDGSIGRGLHRMEVRGKDRLGISLMTPPLSEMYARCKKEKRKMEVATVIGVHPVILMACVFRVPLGTDKLSLAGGVLGKPIPVVKTKRAEITIPAYAEIVIEGFIDPRGKEEDGVLGESSGYYIALPNSPSIHVTAVTHRKSGYFHAIMPWGSEVDHLLSFVHGIDFIPKMKREISSLEKVHFIPKTFGSHVVMAINSDNKGEVRRALALALSFPGVKKAVAVSPDVDPEDIHEVEWSMATRFQADRDLILLTNVRGSAIDPSSHERSSTTKVGIDATRPRKDGFERVHVSEEVKRRLTPMLNKLRGR